MKGGRPTHSTGIQPVASGLTGWDPMIGKDNNQTEPDTYGSRLSVLSNKGDSHGLN
jgi:hypothetical protein